MLTLLTIQKQNFGKAGISYAATDALGVYGEISGTTNGEDSDGDTIRDFGGKVGVKFTF